MPFQHHILDHAGDVLDAARAYLESWLAAGLAPVLLVPSPAAADRVRRALAEGPCALGARVETPMTWVRDRWDLFGDGRRIVSSFDRALLVRRACLETERAALEATPGVVDLLARLAREALPHLTAPVAANAGLSAAERDALMVLERYAELLQEAGCCESSQAAAVLPEAMEAPAPLVLAGFDDLDCAEERMTAALAQRTDVVRLDDGCRAPSGADGRASELQGLLERLFKPAMPEPLRPTGRVRFLLPAGRYAAPTLVASAVAQAVADERLRAVQEGRDPLPVAVTARDPRALFDDVAGALLEAGAASAVSASRAFADTAFGRAFLALHAFACGAWSIAQASDFALGPFSGIGIRTACELDAAWRGDRTVERARIAADLARESEAAADALTALEAGDVDGALAGFEARLRARADLDPAFRAEQLAAVSCARRFASACSRANAAFDGALPLLERMPVSSSARSARDEGARPDALFMSLDEAAELPACSCAALVLCDLDAGSYPVRLVEDGGTLLLEKLGLGRPADALAASRRRFFRALSSACETVVCERVLNTEDANEAYPSVMFEELLDCYREADAGEDDRATGLPKPLVAFAMLAGEDALHDNLALVCEGVQPRVGEGGATLSWELPAAGAVSPEQRPRIVLPRSPREGLRGADAALALSPSALESYLECPYKWFALRRLRLSEPDAGFGPLEMGSFSHNVLRSFYEHFREAGHAKVDSATLPEARALLGETFDRHLESQRNLKRSVNPLIPRTAFERAETADLRKRLVRFLDREALLLPGFEPVRFEFDFGSSEPFPYAGCLLRGSVDRIDVNGAGQAVVIDYKGSLNGDYALDSASPAAQAGGAVLPHKVQTLMYAQVARKVLGLDVVGALYVSYGRDRRVSGAFDRTVVGERDVPGIDVERCGVPGPAGEALGVSSFGELVDAVEDRIARAVRTLADGCIGPDPRGGDPCGYCPVLACEKRMGA